MPHSSTKVTRSPTKPAKSAADRRRAPAKYKNEVAEALHRSASALHRVGAMDGQTMRNFDVTCIERPARWDKTQVRKLRQRLQMSQPILAAYLNSTPSTVAQWESGAKRPSGIAARLLHVLAKHGPDVLK